MQYASSCESVGGARFKLRTSERNYTFTADTEGNAEEWIRVLNKVIDKQQQEGETVRLVIPLEAVVDIERGPSLEFAETIEIKVVDAEDSISIGSYFFASFPDNQYAFEVLQKLLDSRPTPALPKVSSEATLQGLDDTASEHTIPARPSSSSSGHYIPKIGSILRPLGIGGDSKSESRVPIAAPKRSRLTDHFDEASDADHSDLQSDEESDQEKKGYPPKQTGPPPPGMDHQPSSWPGSWIRNPAAKLFGTSPSSSDRKMESARRRHPPRKTPVVTEVVEPALISSEDDFSESDGASTLSPKRRSFSTEALPGEDPIEHQFHKCFALPEQEELIARA